MMLCSFKAILDFKSLASIGISFHHLTYYVSNLIMMLRKRSSTLRKFFRKILQMPKVFLIIELSSKRSCITMCFSKRMKQSREKQGMTLAELGRKIGKTEATVQRYESGNIKNLKNDTIESIATALNVNPAYLMGWVEENDDEVQHRAAHLEGELTDDEWQRVLDYADYIRSKRK
ncbi:HTH_XRE superfamily transcriptional regulator [Staphylococcus phage phiSa2wa-st5.3]|nr:HTH_XRE superfamily transcriptional regulator [Staphylococcus phage phiSa2wa-st5.2]UXL90933.1 HTH_XRE superfamily transcriptional regulator [Staphylococcus phage phiSa2wa-st5.3]UXL91006.1 HTH_XRE superfamily transcriptional regulator [Staphylococcus phage phiSa2wa-st5.4]UYL85563.1 helix-turn-helix domain-containing protein [Staphylococcus phage phiSa2wa-st5.5]UYL85639.1 helix-turn-helix domain-containing protein [Staphylococcus phage phiSa2wa-st5.8]UYL85714.1 helix-turn-helix domain-contain